MSVSLTIDGLERRVISFEISQSEGEAAVLDVVTGNPGIGVLTAGPEQRGSLSVGGVTVFEGRMASAPSDLGGLRVTLELIAAPADLDDQLAAFADTLRQRPWFDPLFFGGGNPPPADGEEPVKRDPAEVLETRAAHFHIDPVSHAISLSDVIDGTATIALGTSFDQASLDPQPQEPPLLRASVEVSAEWNQEADGTVDIANRVCGFPIQTMTDPSSVGTAGAIGNDSGWSVESADTESERFDSPEKFWTGETQDVPVVRRDAQGNIVERSTVQQRTLAPLDCWKFHLRRMLARYRYSQSRREQVFVTMAARVAPVVGAKEETLSALSLSSVTEDTETPAWQPDTQYLHGDVVQRDGRYFECRLDHVSPGFFSILPSDRQYQFVDLGPGGSVNILVQWVPVQGASKAALADARSASFFDTDRGREAVAHAALRLNALLRRRMRCYNITFRGEWDLLKDVSTKHAVSLTHWLYPGGVTGKVISYRKAWNAGDSRQCYVEVTIGVCAGTAAADPDYDLPSGYSDAFEDGYTESWTGSVGPVSFELQADAPVEPVNPYRLGNPDYAVVYSRWDNLYPEQIAAARAAEAQGRLAVDAVNDLPTSYEVRMRDISSTRLLLRRMVAACKPARP